MSRARHAAQMDLLAWQAPEVVRAFDPAMVRGGTLAARIARAVSVALHDCHMDREDVARRMSIYLGARVSKAMLDAYASAAREDHAISLPRFMALIDATGDRRLLELLAEGFGWAVIERRHLPLIDMAAVTEQMDELAKRRDALRREARAKGAL